MAEVFEHRELDATPGEVASILRDPGSWLEGCADRAGRFGEAVDVRLRGSFGLGPLKRQVSKRSRLEVGESKRVRDRILVTMTWEATGFAGLFPVMDALVELQPMGAGRCRLLFWGRYDPPLGRTGDLGDRLVAHEVAEETVGQLLDSLVERVVDEARSNSEVVG